jgi:signal transduction histidine kinase
MARLSLAWFVAVVVILALGARAWLGAGENARRELADRGEGVVEVLAAALRDSRRRGREAEDRESDRLAASARRIRSELARPLGPASARLAPLLAEERLGRAFLLGPSGQRVAHAAASSLPAPPDSESPGSEPPGLELEWRRAHDIVAPILSGAVESVRDALRPNLFATLHRIAVALRMPDGGALLVEGDAEQVAALQRGTDLRRVLEDSLRLPDIAHVSISAISAPSTSATTIEAGDEPTDPPGLALTRTLPVESDAAPSDPAMEVRLVLSTARVDEFARRERVAILLWGLVALAVATLGAILLRRASRRRDQESLRRAARDREERRMAEAGLLTGLLVHEISGPLNALSLQVAGLSSSAPDESLEKIRRSLGRLRTSLESFLAVASSTEASPGETWSSVELRRALHDVAEEFPQIRARLEEPSSGESFSVSARGPVLDQALRNLLRNAFQSSPPAETVLLRWSLPSPDRLEVSILDRGPGFPASLLSDGPTLGASGRTGGHGLGLFLTRRVVERLGGRLYLSLRPDGGSEARVVLPLSAQ